MLKLGEKKSNIAGSKASGVGGHNDGNPHPLK
jgi:hypothetical protein